MMKKKRRNKKEIKKWSRLGPAWQKISARPFSGRGENLNSTSASDVHCGLYLLRENVIPRIYNKLIKKQKTFFLCVHKNNIITSFSFAYRPLIGSCCLWCNNKSLHLERSDFFSSKRKEIKYIVCWMRLWIIRI